ncbi:MAG: hypothetical protein IJY92_02175, partial [Alphaproteobacteria bacterium]|nr:hypothetical protein [Alphaproteobacteria bacterium]
MTLSSPVLAETTLTPSEELETVVYDSSNFSRTEVSSDTTIDLAGKNLTYSGIESSSNGGVFFVNSNKTLENGNKTLEFINSDETTDPLLLFKDNTASFGGVIYNFGDITFGGDTTFSGNTASSYGGAIENSSNRSASNATITFNGDATFTGNSVTGPYAYGGAIYNDEGVITFVADASFMGNTASREGGAIYNDADTSNSNATITFNGDSTFIGNTTSSTGGAIYNYAYNSNVNAAITFNEGSTVIFSDNTASYGGAIHNYAYRNSTSNAIITFNGDATFMGNTASSNGGAIYNYAYNSNSNATITFGENSTITFSENYVNDTRNDIYNYKGTINILGTVASDIHLISDGGTIGLKAKDIDGNGKVTYGGSYSLTDTILDLSGDGGKEVSIEDLSLSNVSVKWDVEINENDNGYDIISDIATLTPKGEFSTGKAFILTKHQNKWFDVLYSDIYDASMFAADANVEIIIDALYKLKDIYLADKKIGFSINFVDTELTQSLGDVLRTTTASSFDLSQYNLTFNEGETLNYMITEKDLSNGSMGILGLGKKTIIGATNKAKDTVINANGTSSLFNLRDRDELTLSNLTISNANTALDNYSNTSGKVTLNTVDFTNNSSSTGGAIYNYANNPNTSSTITFGGDTTFSGNTASSNGGAIYNDARYSNVNATITFNEGSTVAFSDNTASKGGAIYNYAYESGSGTITFEGETIFSDNTASSYGGAIYNYAGTYNSNANASIVFGRDTVFTNNSVTGSSYAYGGAIDNGDASTITFNGNATFTGNSVTATGARGRAGGGAIDNGDASTITFNGNATFTGNSVTASSYAYGGAIYNDGGDITFAADASFMGNTASSDGGAIYNDGTITFGGDATFTGNSITGSSYAYGGAIYNEGDITFGENSILFFENNKANGEKNDIYSDYGTINILGTVASNIHLISEGGTIGLKAKDIDGDGKVTYGGSYTLTDTMLDLSGDGGKEIVIDNLTIDNSGISWDAEVKDIGESYIVTHDISALNPTDKFVFGKMLVVGNNTNQNEWYDVFISNQDTLFDENADFSVAVDGWHKKKDIYNENNTKLVGVSVNFSDLPLTQTLGDFLRSTTASTIDLSQYDLNIKDGEPITYMIAEK